MVLIFLRKCGLWSEKIQRLTFILETEKRRWLTSPAIRSATSVGIRPSTKQTQWVILIPGINYNLHDLYLYLIPPILITLSFTNNHPLDFGQCLPDVLKVHQALLLLPFHNSMVNEMRTKLLIYRSE